MDKLYYLIYIGLLCLIYPLCVLEDFVFLPKHSYRKRNKTCIKFFFKKFMEEE